MSITIWRILCLTAAALFVATVLALFVTRLLKNKYYHNYTADELIKKKKTANSANDIYFTSGETRNFIRKYAVCKSAFERYLVCNFVRKFKHITYYVIQYSRGKRVISVQRVTESHTGTSSKVVALKKRCAHVNVVIGEADGAVINSEVIRPIAVYKLRLYAFLKSAAIFFGLFVVRHLIIELLGGNYTQQYLAHFLNYAALGGSFLFSVLIYFVTVLCFRRKNAKQANGGVLEYEFV